MKDCACAQGADAARARAAAAPKIVRFMVVFSPQTGREVGRMRRPGQPIQKSKQECGKRLSWLDFWEPGGCGEVAQPDRRAARTCQLRAQSSLTGRSCPGTWRCPSRARTRW